jgi:hypothetical protein
MSETLLTAFAGARLLEPIDRPRHIQFMERHISGERVVDEPQRQKCIVGDAACREFAEAFPCPQPSYPAEEQDWVDPSLRKWSKSTDTHSTDQNVLCECRYNRYINVSGLPARAAQTRAVWNPPLHRATEPSKLDFGTQRLTVLIKKERDRIRLHRLVADYERDWRTQAERENLVRATKKARCSPHGLPPRSIVKDIDGRVPLNVVPTLKTGRLPQPPAELVTVWNDILLEHSKNDKTPLKEEIDFYPPTFVEHSYDGRERASDDERVSERQFDGINDEDMRETTEGEPHREKWLKPRRKLFNPLGKKWNEASADDIADVTEHPDFVQTTREYDIEFSNLRVNEAAEQLGLKPNTLSQRISRQELASMYDDVDFSKAIGKYFCVVTLNGRNHLKILGEADASLADVLKTFVTEWGKSEASAVKQVRKTAKSQGVGQRTIQNREREAVERIRAAYDTVIGVFVPDHEGFGVTYYHFQGHQELISVLLNDSFTRLKQLELQVL